MTKPKEAARRVGGLRFADQDSNHLWLVGNEGMG